MNSANNHDERIAKMTFASVYPHDLAKVEKKGRTREQLLQVMEWLTGYDDDNLQTHIASRVSSAAIGWKRLKIRLCSRSGTWTN